MNKLFPILLFLTLPECLFAQKSASYFRSVEYFDKSDSTKNYAVMYRPNGPARKLLVLIPGLGESPQLAEIETDIPEVAASKGILTAIICNNEGNLSFQIDENAQFYLDSIIPLLLHRNNIPDDSYYLGGFSLGGSGVVKYVQYCNFKNMSLKPKAVFAIDPPLDFVRLYKVYQNWLNDSTSFTGNKPLYKMMIQKMQTFFKGNLNTAYDNYVRFSPYSYDDDDKFGVRYFENMPALFYCEPDYSWAVHEKRWSGYDLNVIDNASFVNELLKAGNKDVKLVLTQNKGYRKILKFKHPHSWSIADVNETVKWLLKY